MTEKDYIDASDLAKLRIVQAILRDCMCREAQNKRRLASMKGNVALMVDKLSEQIEITESE
jgi:hypothetical protein